MAEKVMLLLVGGRSATPAIMGALQFIHEVDRVKFLLCEHRESLYVSFQQKIVQLLRSQKADLFCDYDQDVKSADGNNFDEVTTTVAQLCPESDNLLFVNLTSAPQSMAFAVYNYVRERHPQALPFSVYTHTSQLVPLVPGKKNQSLTKKLTVEDYMTACNTAVFQYKFDVNRLSCTPKQAEKLADFFVANISHIDALLAILRKAGEKIKTPKTIPINKAGLPNNVRIEDLSQLLFQLQDCQLINSVTEKDTQFSYRVETQYDHAFLYGDWLEYYVGLQAKKVGFDSVEMGIELKDFKGEIDVFAVHNTNALICECKTGGYETNDLARLESKAIKLGGNYCVRLFITTAQKAEDDSDFQKLCNQAKNKRIVIVPGNDLPEIGQQLKKEMEDPTHQRN